MSAFVPDMAKLRGLSYEVASLFGMPHLGATYVGNTDHYTRTTDRCIVCGRYATNTHHVAHRHTFTMSTPRGNIELHSPLFALCGSGTTGCHNGFHGGSYLRAYWVWENNTFAREWWDGTMLTTLKPHDTALFAYGHWVIEDTRYGIAKAYRGASEGVTA